jgi:hypothetical protein
LAPCFCLCPNLSLVEASFLKYEFAPRGGTLTLGVELWPIKSDFTDIVVVAYVNPQPRRHLLEES